MLYLPAQLVGPLAGMAAAIVWTHWLAPAPYGLLMFLVASQDLVFLVCLSWWTQFTLRYFGSLDGTRRERFAQSEASIFVLSFAAQVVATILVLLLLREPITPGLAIAAVAYVGTRSGLNHLGERARAQSRIAVYTVGQFAGSLLGLAMAYAAVGLVAATPGAVLSGYAVAQTLGVALMWRRLGIAAGSLVPHGDILKAALIYGLPLIFAGGSAWVAQNSIRLVVEAVAGSAALGLIALGWALGQRLTATLAMLVITASFPLAVQNLQGGSRADAYRQISLGGILVIGLIVPAAIGLCMIADPFVTLLVAAPFRASTIEILPFAAAANALRNIRIHIADPVFLLIERPHISMSLNAIDGVCVFAGCLAGLIWGGLIGAAFGCLAATIISFGLGLLLAQRAADFTFPYKDAGKVALASTIMGAALLVVPWSSFGWTPLLRMMVEMAAGTLIYGAALAALNPIAFQTGCRRLVGYYRVGIGVPLR